MHPSFHFSSRLIKTGILAIACLTAIPQIAEAKGPKSHKNGNNNGRGNGNKDDRKNGHDDNDRRAYIARPRSTFVLSLGTGYAGRGYYYGPANSAYYYQRSDVSFYATREAAPREYYGNDSYRGNSTDAAVQRALARKGYYHGSIDGAIGRQSSRAISRYQRDHGLRATGGITTGLLRSLGLQ